MPAKVLCQQIKDSKAQEPSPAVRHDTPKTGSQCLTPSQAPPAAKEHLGRGSWKWQSPVFAAAEWFVLEVLLVWARSRKASELKLPFPFLGLEVLPKNQMGDFQVFQRRREIFVLVSLEGGWLELWPFWCFPRAGQRGSVHRRCSGEVELGCPREALSCLELLGSSPSCLCARPAVGAGSSVGVTLLSLGRVWLSQGCSVLLQCCPSCSRTEIAAVIGYFC